MHSKRRVVVTGMGWVTNLGQDLDGVWGRLLNGDSGIGPAPHLPEGIRSKIAGLVRDFEGGDWVTGKEKRVLDPFIQYGMYAGCEAIVGSKLDQSDVDKSTVGIAIGSGIGGLTSIETNHEICDTRGPSRISPFLVPNICVNIINGHLSIRYGYTGPNFAAVTACATSLHNIGLAYRSILYGEADAMVCGGSEKSSTLLGIGGFSAMKALSTRNDDPAKASRPWDRDRDGFVLSDGAGVLVIEALDTALARGAEPLAELVGFGMSGDAHHIVAPNGKGAVLAMRRALSDAGCQPSDIDYINAHGTSTPIGDLVEINAIKETFGDHAYSPSMLVSSTKSQFGHVLGATGAIESIACIMSIQRGEIPPTINLDNPDEGCDLNLVANEAAKHEVRYAMNNSFGFGGTNACMIFKRYEGDE